MNAFLNGLSAFLQHNWALFVIILLFLICWILQSISQELWKMNNRNEKIDQELEEQKAKVVRQNPQQSTTSVIIR